MGSDQGLRSKTEHKTAESTKSEQWITNAKAACSPAAAAVAGRQAMTRSRPIRRPFAKGRERRPATANSATSSCLDRSDSSTDGNSFSDALDQEEEAIRDAALPTTPIHGHECEWGHMRMLSKHTTVDGGQALYCS
jgi:hypothetical protein